MLELDCLLTYTKDLPRHSLWPPEPIHDKPLLTTLEKLVQEDDERDNDEFAELELEEQLERVEEYVLSTNTFFLSDSFT